ncbi:MAG: hypothetical protein VB089_00960 [Anaerolineaceae bacterium]|nr:hypothetical protein [Anaerolineaceae bacterium]
MKKSPFVLLFAILLAGCNIPAGSPTRSATPGQDAIGTAVYQTLTAAPIHTITVAGPTATRAGATAQSSPTPTGPATVTATATLTPTSPPEDPKSSLGEPTYRNTLDNGKSFGIDESGYEDGGNRITIEDGKMVLTSLAGRGYRGWRLTTGLPQDFYLEGTFNVRSCVADDQYGLVLRAPDFNSGMGYYFIVSCDGRYNFTRWDANGTSSIQNWEKGDPILAGSNQTNRLGVLARGGHFSLYANGKLLKELDDTTFSTDTRFGVYISGAGAGGFTYELDEIDYWVVQ